jgi:tRNA-intron endonuclease
MKERSSEGKLFKSRIVIWDIGASRELFWNGFYGKPLGIPKPKERDFNAPLILDLMEGYYLAKKKKINIFDEKGKKISLKQLKELCSRSYTNFQQKIAVYEKLRNMGYVVTSGIKFGSDFAVYEKGPGIDHAPYIVQVLSPESKINATDVVRAGRLATTVRKQFVIAVADEKAKSIDFLRFDWWKA